MHSCEDDTVLWTELVHESSRDGLMAKREAIKELMMALGARGAKRSRLDREAQWLSVTGGQNEIKRILLL